MNTTFLRRAAAGLSVVALSFAAVPVQAAGVVISTATADRQTFTIDLPAGVDLAATDDITLKITTTADGNPVDLSGNQITGLTVDGNDEFAQTSGNRGDTNGNIVVTNIVSDPADAGNISLTLTSALTDNTAYTVSYIDNQGNFGAAMVNSGTSSQVTVTATVEPTLTLAVANATVDLGTLSAASATTSTTDPTATVTTNAASGFTLTLADDATAGLTSATASSTIAAVADSAQATGTEGFSVEISETADPQNNGDVAAGFTAGGATALTTSAQTIASGTGPNAGYVATANIEANISAITPAASDYTTTLTFSVTGNF